MWERAVSLHSATDETTSDLAVSIMELIRSTIEFVSPAMLVLLLRMVSKTAFPDGGHQTPHSGSTPGYATAVEFIKMLHGTPALLIISKGEAPAKEFISLVHNLLSTPRTIGDTDLLKAGDRIGCEDTTDVGTGKADTNVTESSEVDNSVGSSAATKQAEAITKAGEAQKDALRRVIMPDPVVCSIFQTALRRSQNLGTRFRKAYIAMVCKVGLHASIEMDIGGDRELDDGTHSSTSEAAPAGSSIQEAFFSRQLSILQVLFESYPKRTNELGEELHRLSGRAPEIGADKGGTINDLIDEFEGTQDVQE